MYLNYKNFSIEFSEDTGKFRCSHAETGDAKPVSFLRDGVLFLTGNGKRWKPGDYRQRKIKIDQEFSSLTGTVFYSDGPEDAPEWKLFFRLDSETVTVGVVSRGVLHASGILAWGDDPEHSTFGVRLRCNDRTLRAACGPAVSRFDNALFDRLTDRALEFQSAGDFRVRYDWEAENYRFDYANGLDFGREFRFRIHRNFCREKFNIPYAPIRKTHGFQTPPAGWMTWYALQFDTSAKTVLENAAKLRELFGKYCDKLAVWVDWEWNHESWSGKGVPGVDSFTPRADAYPDGLAPVAAAISELGLIPALWIGATNEGQNCKSFQEHPEWVLGEKKEWCGRYWIDPTHPGVLKEYIPAVFRTILERGFRMIKWDCLPATLAACDTFHDRFHDPSVTSETAMRALVRAVRETIGPDVYMLSCSGETERDICFAMDQFSAARIGGDVFSWKSFLSSAMGRVFHCYPWHNTALYTDADNLIVRDEFNTMAQARSRVSFYGLTGLPVTMGDDLRRLPPERCELIGRILPTVDIHPMDLESKESGRAYGLFNLFVCKKFGSWNVAGVTNFTTEPLRLSLDLRTDLHLAGTEGGRFAVCDFWNRRFLGVFGSSIPVEIPPEDTAVLRVTPLEGVPEIIFSSRHITQGAVEFSEVRREPDGTLSGTAQCVPGEVWRIMLQVPEEFEFLGAEASVPVEAEREAELIRAAFSPQDETRIDWVFRFRRKTVR